MGDAGYLSIGEVLSLLKPEFADLTISKIRFLESQGLLDPERTPSGYRKFYETDIDRLRWILRQQHENYLPLKVIKGKLGTEPDDGTAPSPSDGGAELGPIADRTPQGTSTRDLFATLAGQAGTPPPVLGTESRTRSVESEVPPPSPRFSPASPGMTSSANARRSGRLRASDSAHGLMPRAPGVSQLRRPPGMNPGRQPSGTRPALNPETDGSRDRATSPTRAAPAARGPTNATRDHSPDPVEPKSTLSLTLEELTTKTGNTRAELIELEQFGLITGKSVDGVVYYDAEALTLANLAAGFLRYGVGARHLRMYRTSAEREATFFEQVVMPMLKQRNPQARKQAIDALQELSALGEGLRASLLRQALRGHTGP